MHGTSAILVQDLEIMKKNVLEKRGKIVFLKKRKSLSANGRSVLRLELVQTRANEATFLDAVRAHKCGSFLMKIVVKALWNLLKI